MKVYVVTKKRVRLDCSNGYYDTSTWFENLSIFDRREKALDFMKEYAITDSNNFINSNPKGVSNFVEWMDGTCTDLDNRICYDYLRHYEGFETIRLTLTIEEKELR